MGALSGAHDVVNKLLDRLGWVQNIQLPIRADSDGADGREPGVGRQVGVGVPALAAGVQAVAVGVLAGDGLDLPVVANLPDPVDPLRVALGDVELPGGGEGDGLGLVEGRALRGVGAVLAGVTVERPARHHLDPAVLGHLEDHVIIDEVEGVVQGVDGDVCGPVELHLVQGQRSGAGHGLPRGAVVLVARQGGDHPELVNHADVVTISDVDSALGSDGQS